MSQAQAICQSLTPADARYEPTVTVYLAHVAVGTEKQYSSALRANTLSASEFKDVNGGASTPGTVDVYYETDGGSDVSQCAVSVDEHFAHHRF